jgi:hypothetical protein
MAAKVGHGWTKRSPTPADSQRIRAIILDSVPPHRNSTQVRDQQAIFDRHRKHACCRAFYLSLRLGVRQRLNS